MKYKTRKAIKGHIQKGKEDWWDCFCGKQHKGFPYRCPRSSLEEFTCKATSEASKRLVGVHFNGVLPAFIAVEIHLLLKQSKKNTIWNLDVAGEYNI